MHTLFLNDIVKFNDGTEWVIRELREGGHFIGLTNGDFKCFPRRRIVGVVGKASEEQVEKLLESI